MCGMALAASLALADLYGAGPVVAQTQSALSQEPLYAEIVARAHTMESTARTMRAGPAPGKDAVTRLEADAKTLSALDMKGHLDLAARGTDGDLKCILKGISQDLPRKATAVEAAQGGPGEAAALDELIYLLDDNAGVIVAPPKPPA